MTMVEDRKKKTIATVLFLVATGLLFAYLGYLIASEELSLQRWQASYLARRSAEEKSIADSILYKNHTWTLDGIKIKYCGMEKDKVLFDVYILDLDPLAGYRYRIDKKEAKKGFLLAKRRFQATYVDPNKIQLYREKKPSGQ